ncbi:hypothetical protein AC578_6254 [Pseudocercospora eumusae]|uniref:N-acetyltransferase domain-containing protein n=1 Tax=Pseudocercospora eumusae TaxID=321146 RepID=A0A139H061_9PEZI|nr:hypothetical protein AC578_6254 [Pseudocercospora eumusae]
MAEYKIRPGTLSDAGALDRIHHNAKAKFKSIPQLADIGEGSTKLFEPGVVAEWLQKGRVWLAEENSSGEPVGFIAAFPMDSIITIREVSVNLEHNGKGVGSLLLNAALGWARGQAMASGTAARVSLFTYPDVPWNGKWYEKRGFREVLPVDLGREHIAKMDLDVTTRGLVRGGYRRSVMLWKEDSGA